MTEKHHKARSCHLISPEGKPVTAVNLVQFAKENWLCQLGIYRLASGRIRNHRGWMKDNNLDLFKQAIKGI